jgi:hypothetical protein
LSPEAFADRAYQWFRKQGSRPIDRQEWDGSDRGWVLWVLADDGTALVSGSPNRPDRPPDRVTRLEAPSL